MGGIECLIQRREGFGVVHQVDLHAADVDRLTARGLDLLDRGDRVFLGSIEMADTLEIDRPRPGSDPAGVGIDPARLAVGDGVQYPGRQFPVRLGGGDRGLTHRGRREQRGQRHLRCRAGGGEGRQAEGQGQQQGQAQDTAMHHEARLGMKTASWPVF